MFLKKRKIVELESPTHSQSFLEQVLRASSENTLRRISAAAATDLTQENQWAAGRVDSWCAVSNITQLLVPADGWCNLVLLEQAWKQAGYTAAQGWKHEHTCHCIQAKQKVKLNKEVIINNNKELQQQRDDRTQGQREMGKTRQILDVSNRHHISWFTP